MLMVGGLAIYRRVLRALLPRRVVVELDARIVGFFLLVVLISVTVVLERRLELSFLARVPETEP